MKIFQILFPPTVSTAALVLFLLACGWAAGQAAPAAPAQVQGDGAWTLAYTGSLYTVYSQAVSYALPFPITDMRTDEENPALYQDKQSYDLHSLTIYRAHDGQNWLDGRPVVFFVHGGAWIDGYADWYTFTAWSLTGAKGWVTVVMDYRLTSDQVFIADQYCPDRITCAKAQSILHRTKAAWYPDNLEDVAQAFQWTRDHVAAYGGHPDQMVTFGHSAGGHLAALLAVHPDFAALRPAMKGVISMSGAYSLTHDLTQAFFYDALQQTFEGGVVNNPELALASPTQYATAGAALPPFFLLDSEDDLPPLPAQTQVFTQVLQGAGAAYQYAFLPGYDHVSEMAAFQDPQALPTRLVSDYIESLFYRRLFLPCVSR